MSIRKMKLLQFLCKFTQLFIILALTPFMCGVIFKSELSIPISVLALLCIYIMNMKKEIWNILLVIVYLLITNLFELTDITMTERKIFSIISIMLIALTFIREFFIYAIRIKKMEIKHKHDEVEFAHADVEGKCSHGECAKIHGHVIDCGSSPSQTTGTIIDDDVL